MRPLCTPFAFVALLLFTPMLAQASNDATFQRTLSVTGPPIVEVHTKSGNIHISAGASNQIIVVGKIHFSHWGWGHSDDHEVQQLAQNPPIRQSGNNIQIGKQENDSSGSNWIFGGRNISVDYEITVPSGTNLKAASGSGDLRIEAIHGPLIATTGSGDITSSDMQMDSTLSTGSGNIHARAASGTLKLNTGSGDIEVAASSISDLEVHTGSGNIRVNEVQGHLRAGTGSGNVTIQGSPESDWRLTTGSGNISLTVPSSAKFNLDAKCASGKIHSDVQLAMQGALDEHHVMGTANGGGPTIRAETSSGDIQIEK